MLTYPTIDPIAFHIGPLAVHWYGLMYLFSFLICWAILSLRIRHSRGAITQEQLSDIIFYSMVGTIVGGRLGYMIFYDGNDFFHHPLQIFKVWQGGMSFHGGLLGVTIAMWICARHIGRSLGEIGDLIAPAVPLGLAAGRIGNFINGELWGRVTTMPWGMVFPNAGDLPRHPSQLYECFLEGIVMFSILWIYSRKPRPRWAVTGLFLALYGLFRIISEFFREPDAHIGYIAFGWVTRGQLLSLPMVIIGIGLMIWAYRRDSACANT